MKKWTQSVENATLAINNDRKFIKAYLRRAKSYMELDKFEDAICDYEHLYYTDQSNYEYGQLLSQAKLELQKTKQKENYKIVGVNKDASNIDAVVKDIEENKLVNPKTKVEIAFQDNVYRIRIHKSSVTLSDIKKHLMSQPEKFGMSQEVKYDFSVKTIENGKVTIEEMEDDMDEDILSLFEGKIVLNCWAKS